jgi:hypothetical protein
VLVSNRLLRSATRFDMRRKRLLTGRSNGSSVWLRITGLEAVTEAPSRADERALESYLTRQMQHIIRGKLQHSGTELEAVIDREQLLREAFGMVMGTTER